MQEKPGFATEINMSLSKIHFNFKQLQFKRSSKATIFTSIKKTAFTSSLKINYFFVPNNHRNKNLHFGNYRCTRNISRDNEPVEIHSLNIQKTNYQP